VGGHIVFALARAGVLDLTLVDPDSLAKENTFRHALGMQHQGKTKVAALKEAIEGQLPYVRVKTIAMRIEGALRAGTINLTDYDLVVLATGNPTVELMVNERLHRLTKGPPAVIAWVEPLGIGGHALLTNNGSHTGCFECLYTTPEGEWEGANRAAFAERDQSFGRAWDGCGTLHTPFGAIDAEQTAILAARLVVEALTGKEMGNPLVSWKGDATAFTAAGLRLSARYAFSDDEQHRQRYAYPNGRCSICGGAGERAA
jgi:molybdopterin/thiamine biosynthesis adenylyltransferase